MDRPEENKQKSKVKKAKNKWKKEGKGSKWRGSIGGGESGRMEGN